MAENANEKKIPQDKSIYFWWKMCKWRQTVTVSLSHILYSSSIFFVQTKSFAVRKFCNDFHLILAAIECDMQTSICLEKRMKKKEYIYEESSISAYLKPFMRLFVAIRVSHFFLKLLLCHSNDAVRTTH